MSNKVAYRSEPPKEEIRANLNAALETFNLEPIDVTDIKAIEERTRWYIDNCIKYGVKAGVAGLSTALGIHRSTFYRWSRDLRRGGEHQEFATKVYAMFEQILEGYMLEGNIHHVAGIFFFKNHFGYTDTQDIQVTPKPLGDVEDKEKLEQRYLDSVAEEE